MARPQLKMAGDEPPLVARLRGWSATHWLIALNVAGYVLQILSRGGVTERGFFSVDLAVHHVQAWRWLSSDFLHWTPTHLIFNMIALWAFGPTVERRLGHTRYVALYLLSGLGGSATYLLLWRLRMLDVAPDTQMVGASGCILGVVMAAAFLTPNARVRWIWPPVDLRFRTVAWIYLGLAILSVAGRGDNAGGEAAHLGGAVVGAVLVRNLAWFRLARLSPRPHRFWRPGDPASNFFRPDI